VVELGANAIEIDYRLTNKSLDELLRACEELKTKTLSIHAVCPAPDYKKNRLVAEAYQLSDPDETNRLKAVGDVAQTIKFAARIGAGAVVIHAGDVPMEKVTYDLQKLYDRGAIDTAEGRWLVGELKIKRLKSRGATFDLLLKSLDELSSIADQHGVDVGLENRYYFREYPSFEEMAIIFFRLAGSRIKYWHDTGHAQVQDNLGITPSKVWLEEFGHLLIGVHLHDVDRYHDHLAPPSGGEGAVDFKLLKRYLKPDTIRILEMRDDVSFDAAKAGVDWLREQGIA
jgi:sugar phosphate isomerase/epimerase